MKIIEKIIENSQAFLTIEVEPAEVDGYLEKSYRQVVKKVKIPGFRKGKAPRVVLERHVGKEELLNDALDSLLPDILEQVIKEQEIEAFAQPTVEVTQTEPVVFKATVPLPPTVKLGEYHTIRDKLKVVRLKKADVAAIIEQLRHRRATWEPVERPVQFDDMVVINVEGTIKGETFLDHQGGQYPVHRDADYPVKGFARKLVDMKRDEEKKFNLTFSKDHSKSELAGKKASFRVKVIEIKEEKLPPLDDEFAKEMDLELKTVEALRQRVSDNMKQQAKEKAKDDFEDRVIDAAVEMSRIEYPPFLLDMEVDGMLNQQLNRLQMTTKSPEEFQQRLSEMPVEKLREEFRPVAEKRLVRSLLLGKIAAEEKIKVSDKEVDAEIKLLTKDATENRDEQRKLLNTAENREQMKQVLLTRKTIAGLLEIAGGSVKNIAKKTAKNTAKKTKKKEAK